jgi:hypothetical protein
MKNKITYLNIVLTVICVALTVMILQNANIIQPVQASSNVSYDEVNVNIQSVGGMAVMPNMTSGFRSGVPVYIAR